MKVICHGLDLSDAVSKVSKAVSTRAVSPVLEGIKITAEGNTVIFSATDNELAITKKIKADVLIEGSVLVSSGKSFADFVRTLTNEQVELVSSPNNQLRINYSESVADFPCLNADDFPSIIEIDGAESFTIVKKDFKDLINKVSFSSASDDSRPMLKGVLLEIEERKINAVALDGYRMAICSKILEKTTALTSAVISARCLNEISKIIDDKEEFLRVYFQRNYVIVDLEHTKIVARQLSGDFLNYRQIIPTGYETVVTVNRKMLEATLDRAVLVAKNDKNNLIKMNIVNKKLEITSNSELGSTNEKLDICIDGKDITIAFNSKYLIDVVHAVSDESISMKFKSESSPCIITSVDISEEYLYLILPIRLN